MKNIKLEKNHLILLLILAAGLILRLVYLYFLKDTAFFNPYLMDKHDQKTFILWAEQILQHPWYVDGEPFYMAPFYPYFLAFIYMLFGGSLLLILSFQIIMDVAVCAFIFYLGKKIFNEKVGILAAFFACFYMTSIVYAASILSDSLIFFLYMLFIVLVYFALEKPNFSRWIACGVVLGFAALAKPTIAVYLPFLLVGLYLYPRKKLLPINVKEKLQPVSVILVLLIVSGAVILPVTIRNFYVSGQFIPICTNGRVNWEIGNSSDSIGLFYYPQGELLSPFSLEFWKLFMVKVNIFFTSYEWPQNLNVYLMEQLIPTLKAAFIRFGFVVPVGMGGLILLFRKWKTNFIFISFTLSNVLWVVLFFVVDRYRLPAAGCFMVLSAGLIIWTFEKLKEKKFIPPLLIWLFVGGFAYFYNVIPGPLIPAPSVETFAGLSVKNIQHHISENDLESAYKKAITYHRHMPGDFRANFMLACVLADMNNLNGAVYYLRRTLQLNPEFEPAERFLNDLTTADGFRD